MPVIVFDQIWHFYARGTPMETVSLSGLSLEVNKGELVALVGSTGSGKTTALQHMNGLLLPDRGRVLVEGLDTREKKVRRSLWKRVGLSLQFPEKQFFEETICREVSFGPRNLGLPAPEIDRRVAEALYMVGLDGPGVQQISPFRLSGGDQRRLALASVVALKPEILALDEPTSGIDPGGRKKILSALKKLKAEHGTTIIMASHNMDDVAALADRVVVLNKGRVAAAGTPGQVFYNPCSIREAGLEPPMACEVINRLNGSGFGMESNPLTLPEAAEAICRHFRRRNKE